MLCNSFFVEGVFKLAYVFYFKIVDPQKVISVVSDCEAILNKKERVGTLPITDVDLLVLGQFEVFIREFQTK